MRIASEQDFGCTPAVLRAQEGHGLGDIGINGADADPELGGDFLRGVALEYQPETFPVAGRQPLTQHGHVILHRMIPDRDKPGTRDHP